jgi:hypothetical protein
LATLDPDIADALAVRAGDLYIGSVDELPSTLAIEKLSNAAGRVALPARPSPTAISIEKARDWFVREQEADGSWECAMRTQDTRAGATALVILALANAGMRSEDPALQKGLDWLRRQEPDETYSVSLQTVVLAMLSPDADRAILERNVDWLEKAQVSTGPAMGSWAYGGNKKGTGDNSNSQFAVLALHEASRSGIRVRREVWSRAQKYWAKCANDDGSWGYTIGNVAGTGSMTCAGVVSLWLASCHLGIADAKETAGDISCCRASSQPKVSKGLDWLGRKFSVVENPGGGQTWLYYYLAGLARARRFTGHRFLNGHDSADQSAEMLIKVQDGLTGAFRGGRIEDPTVATAMAILVLTDCSRPALIAKCVHSPTAEWDCHSRDVECLTDHINKQTSRQGRSAYSWHRLPLTDATEGQLAETPLLVISCKASFDLGNQTASRLRLYIENGGLIFAEPSCGESEAFGECLQDLVTTLFPDDGLVLNEIPVAHPLWMAGPPIAATDRPHLLGVSHKDRLCVIYHPTDKSSGPSLSCLWELSQSADTLSDTARTQVDSALAFGTTLALYADSHRDQPLTAKPLTTGTQTRLLRLVRPSTPPPARDAGESGNSKNGSSHSNNTLARAWAVYEEKYADEIDRITSAVTQELSSRTRQADIEDVLKLENAIESLQLSSLLPECSGPESRDVWNAVQSAQANALSAAHELRTAYDAAIELVSSGSDGQHEAEALRREQNTVFGEISE